MSEDFIISFNIDFKEEGIVPFLERLHKELKNEDFQPATMRSWDKEQVHLDLTNFKKLEPHILERKKRGAETYDFHLKEGSMFLSFTEKHHENRACVYKPHGFISLSSWHFLNDQKKWNDAHANIKFPEIADLALATAKAAETDLVIGGWEEYETSPFAHRIAILVIKNGLCNGFMKEHVKIKFKVDLSEEEIDKLVKETAYSVEEKDGFVIINFSAVRKPNRFYDAVKNIVEGDVSK